MLKLAEAIWNKQPPPEGGTPTVCLSSQLKICKALMNSYLIAHSDTRRFDARG
jgi:hypothetical protein